MNRKFLCSLVGLFFVALSQINAQDSIVTSYQKAWRKKIDREISEIKAQLSLNEFNKQSGADSLNKYIFCYAGENYLSLLEDLSTEDASYVQFEGKEIKKADYLGSEASINQLFTELDMNYKRKVIIYVTDVVRPELSPVQNDKEGKPLSVSEYDKDKEFFKQYFSYLLTKLYGAQSGEYTMLAYLRVFRTQPASLSPKGTRFEYTHKRIFNYQKGLPAGCISLLENKIVNNEDGIFTSGGNQSGQVYQCANLIYSTLKSECPNVVNPMLPLTVSQRIDKIKEYLAGGLTDKEEGYVLKLVAETPTKDIPQFFKALTGKMSSDNSNSVLAELDYRTDNEFMFYGNNNYTGLLVQLKKLMERSPDLGERLEALVDISVSYNRVINWRLDKVVTRGSFRENLGAVNLKNVRFNKETGEVSYRLAEFSKDEWIASGCMGSTLPYHPSCYMVEYFWEPSEEETQLEPFDLVLFANFSKENFINDVTAVERGQAIVMPAYFLQYVDLKTDIEGSKRAASLVMDLVTLYSFPWAATKCVTSLRMTYLLLETSGSAINLSFNLIPAINENENMQEVVKTYNELMLVVGAGQLINGVSKINVRQAAIQVKNLSIKTAQEMKQRMKAFVTAVNKNEENIKVFLTSPDEKKRKAAEALLSMRDEQVKNGKEVFEEDGWELLGKTVVSDLADLAKYPNIRKHLGNSRVKQYLNNAQLYDLEKNIRKAHPDVLKYMNELDEYDFAEMVSGYRDLMNGGQISTFENAIKTADDFYGKYNGWYNYWKLTPSLKYAMTTIDDLRASNKLLPTGEATDLGLGYVQSFTSKGDFINVPLRYNKEHFLGLFGQKGLDNITKCLDELRKVPERNMEEALVFSGKTFSKLDFENKFIGGKGNVIEYFSFVSSSLKKEVAIGFIELTAKHVDDGEKIAVIQRIITKRGVYIDDLSDWGKNLGKSRHADAMPVIQIQEEVLMNAGKFQQISEPIPMLDNSGNHATIAGYKAYYLDLIEQ